MIIANLLRCINPKSHAVDPFADLWRPRKGKVFGIPPSAAMKYRRVRALAADARRADVTAATEAFFDERIRNAFRILTTSSPTTSFVSPTGALRRASPWSDSTGSPCTASRSLEPSSTCTNAGYASSGRRSDFTKCRGMKSA